MERRKKRKESHPKYHSKIAARTDICSFKVAILFIYESALRAKGLENE